MERIVIVGATSAMAEHCARLWAQEASVDLTLIGRDPTRLEKIAADLRARSPRSSIHVLATGFLDPKIIKTVVDELAAKGAIDKVLIAHGALPDQTECEANLSLCKETLEINGISPVLFAEAFAFHMKKAGYGTLGIIGSVAGDRGRKSNYAYGAGKALVACYAQGLQHRFAKTNVKIVLIKPGPTDTPMTAKFMDDGMKLAPVEAVAKGIVRGMKKGQAVVYVPCKWQLIMLVITHLPSFLFNKLDI